MELHVLVNGKSQKGQHRSCSAKTTPFYSWTSQRSRLLSRCHRNLDWSLSLQCTLRPGRWNQACSAPTQNKDGDPHSRREELHIQREIRRLCHFHLALKTTALAAHMPQSESAPLKLCVLLKGNFQKGKHSSCSAKTSRFDSFSSHTSSHSGRCQKKTQIGHFWSKAHWALEYEIKHVEISQKTRMEILTPGSKISTSREKFGSQAIFAFHWKQVLWQLICLIVKVTPMEVWVLVNGNSQKV